MAGRVLGALLVGGAEEPTAAELADALRVGPASISSATRELERIGVLVRLRRPGERRDRFGVAPGAWRALALRRVMCIYSDQESRQMT